MQYDFEFAKAMQQAGLFPPNLIISDGRIHRFDHKRKGDKTSWYVHNGDHGAYGNWRFGIHESWAANSTILTLEEKQKLQAKIKAAREQRQAELQKHASQALMFWNKAQDVIHHIYLRIKHVESFGLRQYGGSLLIPLYDIDGKLWSLQFINPGANPSKKFLPGGKKKGCFHLISSTPGFSSENPMCPRSRLGRPTDLPSFFVVEGYATGASVHMATGAPVVVAFDAGNLEPVIAALRTVYPDSPITIAADNDQWGEVNTGKLKAEEAAAKHGCKVVLPEFSTTTLQQCKAKGLPLPTDWNDKHVLEGF